jgi:hypothetical protein
MRSRRKKGGQVTALMYIYREQDDEEFKIEVEVSGYYTPEQHATEVDPPISADVDFESAVMTHSGKTIVLTEDEIIKATEKLIEEVSDEKE